MNVYDAITKRKSIRSFTDHDVPDEKIHKLLECAMSAPTACNKKPWMFYVVKNKKILQELRGVTRYSNYNAPLMIVVAGDDKRSLGHRPNDFWIQDCSAATQNMLLMAHELGLGTCWCGLFPLVTPQKSVRKILGLAEHIIPMALIHIGYTEESLSGGHSFDAKRVCYFYDIKE